MRTELVEYRVFGQPKISKPKILKGIKPTFSRKFCGRTNQVYVLGEDVYVYFFDLFSQEATFPETEDMALPTLALERKYPKRFQGCRRAQSKFVYADGWRTIRNRNEGYVCFPGLIPAIFEDGLNTMHLQQLQFAATEALATLSTLDRGFCQIEQGDFRYAEYLRFVSDMIGHIYTNYKPKNQSV